MAEFKLGRIRFVWRNNWASSIEYYKDDIVRNGGNTYVCIQGHVAPETFDVQETVYWEKLSDGIAWRSEWTVSTYYRVNDIVKYGGYLYVANTAHTSSGTITNGLEFDQAKWDLFSESFEYKADWTISTRYKINDIAKYNGIVYVCTQGHTSATSLLDGLELDQSSWDIFSTGLFWKGEWQISIRYRANDVVKYGGQLYVCNNGHASAGTLALGLEDDQSSWDYLNKGIEYRGTWSPSVRYRINDLAKQGGGVWIAVTAHTSTSSFQTDQANWNQFVEGLEFEDSWNSTVEYQPGDFTTYGGYSYVSKTNNTNSVPDVGSSDWDLFTTGFQYTGDYEDNATDKEYLEGDVVRLGGYTYLCVARNSEQRPPNETFWKRLNSGIEWKDSWTDAVFYNTGDAVRINSNSYVCILAHTSDEVVEENRPDQDVTGTYWNLLSGGIETNVVTTQGDLVYYSGSGPTRLPIGKPGQSLIVNTAGTAPSWEYLGRINNVYYVETNGGLDLPAPLYGATLDQPWKTIHYASEQILKGALRPNAGKILEYNKSFIQEEVVEWIDFQTANEIAPYTSAFTYNKSSAREDVGSLVAALIWDLTHNGNVRSREAALAYFTSQGVSTVAGIETETVASINYCIELIDSVLSNNAPSTNYQDENSVATPITQVINNNLDEESEAQSLIESLLLIVTNAITAGDTTLVPRKITANDTIFVKTGEFNEVLPIIVPESTAVVGDELRSTRIRPAGSLINISDVPYSLDALNRLRLIIDDIVTNTAIAKTTGNALTQNTSRPAGGASAGTDAANLVQQIYDQIDWRINSNGTEISMAGTNVPETSTEYTYATAVLEFNREFLVAEIVAYIADTYPAYDYNQESCSRDVNNYIDAIKMDLIYTGNYKSLMAARYYANAVQGSLTEDMFYMRNGTGLRNASVQGLTGVLADQNSNGLFRPTAGAFVSLDPGFGTEDKDVWITSKSPYVQNISTFGTGCVGLKVDGSLHNGGNDSIVANDFTQIISDGIGAWCTGLGRTELVSVFTYYNYIGYLAEAGGKIRATNGNNSYGTYGAVAEGVDPSETPLTGTVNNLASPATIERVLTSGDTVLVLEYENAGVDYSASTTAIKQAAAVQVTDPDRTPGMYFNVIGTTDGAGTEQEFTITITDLGIAELFKIDNGGTGHAQGDTISISVSDIGGTGTGFDIAVDVIGDSTEIIVDGNGFGLEIDSVNILDGAVFQVRLTDPAENVGGAGYISSQGVAQVGDSTSIAISNTDLRINSQYVGMAIYIVAGAGVGQYAYIDSYNSGTKTATVSKFSDDTAGWDHLVPGTLIKTVLDDTTQYEIEPRLSFTTPASGLYSDTTKARAIVTDGKISKITIIDPGNGYATAPTMTIIDPNNTADAPTNVRIGDGVLGQPTWTNRGSGFTTAQAFVLGYGYANKLQSGRDLTVNNLTGVPEPGSNVVLASLPGQYFKLVSVTNLLGSGPYSAILQLSPDIGISKVPAQATSINIRRRYSQVRLTGHDFLDIGTGNFEDSNYPNVPKNATDSDSEISEFAGGRIFYTSTDQDGNFRVGRLFNVEQSTGIATLNADAFNVSGLQQLQLGSVALGAAGAIVTEFSTDGTFTANSDNIVPTQRAIRTYINSQIGGGAGELNVNSITAGVIRISTNNIATTTNASITADAKINFKKGVDGVPVALNYFLQQ